MDWARRLSKRLIQKVKSPNVDEGDEINDYEGGVITWLFELIEETCDGGLPQLSRVDVPGQRWNC